mgnify:CR=1 FL=1
MGKRTKSWNDLSTTQKLAVSALVVVATIPLQPFYKMRNDALGQGKYALQFAQATGLAYGFFSFFDDLEL